MKKVIVIGSPGSGKSVFSRSLHDITGLPLYHLDMMYWNPDKTKVGKEIFTQRLTDALSGDEWIIDGNYGGTLELRMEICDTVIFLDYPTEVCLDGIRARRGKPRADMPWVETSDEEDGEFVKFVTDYVTESRPTVLELLEKHSDKEIHIFKTRAEAENYLNSVSYK